MIGAQSSNLELLQRTLGHNFADTGLLSVALTHGSVSQNGRATPGENYQRLEFLGDRVLGLVVADILDRRFPGATEGELSRWFHRLVSGNTCTEVAREMELAKFLRISGGKPSPSVLGDACEAVLGALYRDGGLPPAAAVIERYWLPRIETASGPIRDPKTELQEYAHRRGFEAPTYAEVLRSGPDHAPEFEIAVTIGDLPPGHGRGRSKREAEQEAASAVLRREGVWSAG